jgi:DNA-binding NtrC family response regulator
VLAPPKEFTPVVLIVDDALGFIVWLQFTLAAGGYVGVPARSTQDAMRLIEEWWISVYLVIVNPALPGIVGIVETLQKKDSAVKVIAIQDTGAAATTIKVDATHSRSHDDWIATVRQVLGNTKVSSAG